MDNSEVSREQLPHAADQAVGPKADVAHEDLEVVYVGGDEKTGEDVLGQIPEELKKLIEKARERLRLLGKFAGRVAIP